MELKTFTPNQLQRVKGVLVQFLRKYGNGRITHHAIRWLQKLAPEELSNGTLVAATLDEQKLTGVIIFGKYGIEESVITVHPDYRNQGIGEMLLNDSLERLNKVYTRVACDNIPSLKLCFSCNLVAIHLFTGPTGKPTLWLAGGDWRRKDILSESPLKSSNK